MTVVYLEASCGHELAWDLNDGPAPSEIDCPEHRLVALWAQRLEPSPEGLPPMSAAVPADTDTA